jgi:hypothetical protein
MARGWESKSIEEQQAEASESKRRTGKPQSPEQQALRRQIDGLELSRKSIKRQLQSATHARHRQMLEESLAELDRQLRKLDKN